MKTGTLVYILLVLVALLVLDDQMAKARAYRAKVQQCMEFEPQADCEMKGVYGK